jgi:hypothetical protein
MAAQPDFWGDLAPEQVRTPVAIMREQAALLGTKTHNLLEAKVETDIGSFATLLSPGREFRHRFLLVVPSLNNYTYELFSISHGIGVYPISRNGALTGSKFENEEEFVDWLREKLASADTRRVISNLLAQVSK